jgi:hypothetical protein
MLRVCSRVKQKCRSDPPPADTAPQSGSKGAHKSPGYCWRTSFNVLRVLFSRGSFLNFFAFKEGMLSTPISLLGGSPTVSGRLCAVYPPIVPMDVDDFIWPLLISLSGLRRVECAPSTCVFWGEELRSMQGGSLKLPVSAPEGGLYAFEGRACLHRRATWGDCVVQV